MKNDDVTAAIDAVQAYRATGTAETLIALAAALQKIPSVWIEVGSTRYRWAERPCAGVHMESVP
jgi:hypothetical protein